MSLSLLEASAKEQTQENSLKQAGAGRVASRFPLQHSQWGLNLTWPWETSREPGVAPKQDLINATWDLNEPERFPAHAVLSLAHLIFSAPWSLWLDGHPEDSGLEVGPLRSEQG